MMTVNSGQESSRVNRPRSPSEIADTACRRGKRRTWCLGITAFLLWVSVAIGFILMVYGMSVFIWPSLTHVASLGPKATDRDWALVEAALRVALGFGMPLTYVWGGLLVLAAIVTMLFVRSSHQASLGQIRAELLDLSQELRRLAENGRARAD